MIRLGKKNVSTVTQNTFYHFLQKRNRVVEENTNIWHHQVSREGSPDLCRYRGNPTDRLAASHLGSVVVQSLFFQEVIKHTNTPRRRWNENPAVESDTDHLPG